jgi:epsilon-lactone hydrolase
MKTGRIAQADVRHSLTERDREAVAAMREEVAPFKGMMSGPGARAPFDEVMEHTPDARGVTYEKVTVGGVPGIRCTPQGARPGAMLLYLHGGAYVLGSANAYRHFAGQIAARAKVPAFIAEYRLAPEHRFPAAVEDGKAAYRGLVEAGARKIVVAGDSAGGGLALALLSVVQNELVPPAAAVVMSPWTDLALTGGSFQDRAEDDPLVTKDMLSKTSASYLDGHDPRDPLASPLYGELAGRPPIQLHVGTSEVLLDDTRRYAERARAAGVDAVAHIWDGMPHVFPSGVGTLEAAEHALALMASFLDDRLSEAPDASQIVAARRRRT